MRRGGVRIEQRKHDEIKLIVAVFDVAASVVKGNVDARRLVGVFEVQFASEFQDQRIDFNCLNASRTVAKGGGDIIAHS